MEHTSNDPKFDVFTDDPTWNVVSLVNVSMSTISLAASTTMAVFVAVARPEPRGLRTPYRRIIFGISVSDILQSIALATGPWAVPSYIEHSFGIGNDATCAINGVSLTIGSTAMHYYVCLLCFYFLCKLKYRMTDQEFYRKYEVKAHVFIALLCFTCSTIGVAFGAYNTVLFRTCCFYATRSHGCRFTDEACDVVGIKVVDAMNIVTVYITFFFNLIGICVIMFQLIRYANEATKNIDYDNEAAKNDEKVDTSSGAGMSQPRDEGDSHHEKDDIQLKAAVDSETNSCSTRKAEEVESADTPNNSENKSSKIILQSLAASFRREIITQAALWVGVYALCYVPTMLSFIVVTFTISNVFTSSIIVAVAYFLFSIGGIFNIFVYTRPKVAELRRRRRELSRLRALWIVFKAGGELPPDEPGSRSKSQDQNQRGDDHDASKEMPKEIPVTPIKSDSAYDNNVANRHAGDYYNDDSQRPSNNRIQIDSAVANDGLSISLDEEDVKYRKEENWSYVQGKNDSTTYNLDHLNEANLRDFGLSFSRNEYVERADHLGESFCDDSGFSVRKPIKRKGTFFLKRWFPTTTSFKSSVGASSSHA